MDKRFTQEDGIFGKVLVDNFKRKKLSSSVKEMVYKKFDGKCGYCGCKPPMIVIDHIIPLCRAHMYKELDANSIDNLMPSCPQCNNYKHGFLLEEFREQLSKQVERARKSSVNFRLAERYGMIAVKDIGSPVVFYFEKHENL